MRTVAGLEPDEDFLLIAPFEPTPLFQVLGQRGFSHESKATADGGWEILFTRGAETAPDPAKTPSRTPGRSEALPATPVGAAVVEVDARGLEPPQPLLKILEAVAALPEGSDLRAHTDRRPMHLYAQLEERGFTGETVEQPDGSFITYVHRI